MEEPHTSTCCSSIIGFGWLSRRQSLVVINWTSFPSSLSRLVGAISSDYHSVESSGSHSCHVLHTHACSMMIIVIILCIIYNVSWSCMASNKHACIRCCKLPVQMHVVSARVLQHTLYCQSCFKKKDVPAMCTDAAHTYTHPYTYVSLYGQCYNRIKMRNGHSQHY